MLSAAKIIENMEIGHNVLHGQWDWMNDPVINSQSWDWDTASTSQAWKHSHNYIHHTFTNILGKDRDLGYEIMRIDPQQRWHPVYLLQPIYNVLLMLAFEWGVAVHDMDFDAVRPGEKPDERRARGPQGDRGQGAGADPEGLHRVAAAERRDTRPGISEAAIHARATRGRARAAPSARDCSPRWRVCRGGVTAAATRSTRSTRSSAPIARRCAPT